MLPKDGMANSVDSDQPTPKEQSDLGLHCLLRPICPHTKHFTGIAFLFSA